MSNPLLMLEQFGQSPWYDNLSRHLIESDKLRKMVDEDGLKGVTSNPTIFEKAISTGNDYDEEISKLVSQGNKDPQEVFDHLAVSDVRQAADILRSVYDKTKGGDGYVSLEVIPSLANDTEGTIKEARRLFGQVNRPNLMIKVPGTLAGLPAVETLIGEGINVNVTLIFSNRRYEAVMNSYLAGLERFSSSKDLSGQQGVLAQVSSVASFFVSRIDAAVDKQLLSQASGCQSPDKKKKIELLLGKTAIANAKRAYQKFKTIFSSSRFLELQKKGAWVQRPLWASTSVKNPQYRDVLYIEELIGSNTINTFPPATWVAFREHGQLRASLEEGVQEAESVLDQLKEAGIDLDSITDKLEKDGVKSFADSYEGLIRCISGKLEKIQQASGEVPSLN